MSERTPRIWILLTSALVILGLGKLVVAAWERASAPPPAQSYQVEHRLTDLEGMLHEARVGNLEGVRGYLAKGLSVNSADAGGETILSVSIESADNPVAAFSLAHGFIPGTEYQDAAGSHAHIGDLALYRATKAGRKDIVQRLLQLGARADGSGNREFSPIAAAVTNGDRDIAGILIKGGANTDGVFLLSNGLPGRQERREQVTLVDIPLQKHDLPMLRQLLELHVALDTAHINSTLSIAIAKDWPEAVAALLENEADPDQLGPDEKSLDRWIKSAAVRELMLGARAAKHFSYLSLADARRVPCQQFVRTLFQGDSDAARKLLARLPENIVAARDDRGWTSAMYALEAGKTDLLPDLIAKGVPLDAVNAKGLTLAGMATEKNALPVLELLAAKKANLNAYGEGGSPPLAIALEKQNQVLVSWLLDRGVKAEPAGPVVRTPLMWAVQLRDQPLVERLLKAGANAKRTDPKGWPVVFYAAQSGSPEILQLIEHAGASLKDELNRAGPLLLRAVGSGEVHQTHVLLSLGVAQTPAIVAAAVGNPEILDLLDEYAHRTGDVRARSDDYWRQVGSASSAAVEQHLKTEADQNFVGALTPLQWVVEAGRSDLIPVLLQHRADPNQLGVRERTPVLIATVRSSRLGPDHGLAALVRLLADHGADVNVTEAEDFSNSDAGGRTALMICIAGRKYETATQLLALGADPESTDAAGRTAADYFALTPPTTAAGKACRDSLSAALKKRNPTTPDDKPARTRSF